MNQLANTMYAVHKNNSNLNGAIIIGILSMAKSLYRRSDGSDFYLLKEYESIAIDLIQDNLFSIREAIDVGDMNLVYEKMLETSQLSNLLGDKLNDDIKEEMMRISFVLSKKQ